MYNVEFKAGHFGYFNRGVFHNEPGEDIFIVRNDQIQVYLRANGNVRCQTKDKELTISQIEEMAKEILSKMPEKMRPKRTNPTMGLLRGF